MRQMMIDFCERRQSRAGRMAGRLARKYGDKFPLVKVCHFFERFWFDRKLRCLGYSRKRLKQLAERLKQTAAREIAANTRIDRTTGGTER